MSSEPSAEPGDYAEHFREQITFAAKDTALLLVDLQYASASRHHGLGAQLAAQERVDEGRWRFDRIEQIVVPNALRLLHTVRQGGGTVVHVALGSNKDDFSDVPSHLRRLVASTDNRVGRPNNRFLAGLEPKDGEVVVRKSTADAFIGTELDSHLRAGEVRTLLLAGVSTNSCVESTARHAADLGYQVVLIEDACAAAHQRLHESSLQNLCRFFATVRSTAEVVKVLLDPDPRPAP
jgi:biuret amidohydrolase